MSRINTNVSSLLAQKTLGRSNVDLQTSLTRLSTGLRINSGKDDPAGLIASENLRRDITSINKAISNSERANQLIGTADSALAQISNLLNDIRGLVVEAANTGVLSDEQIAANQLQVDSSLEALDRIAQVTTFQGRKLLDGSLDFQTVYTAGGATVLDLNIDQANLGAAGSVDVDITISAAATQALITNTTGFVPSSAVQAQGTLSVTNGSINIAAFAGGAADGSVANTTDVILQRATTAAVATAALGTGAGEPFVNTGGGAAFNVTAVANSAADGAFGNATAIVLSSGATTAATYDATLNQINVTVAAGGTIQQIHDAINGLAEFNTSGLAGGATVYNAADNGTYNGQFGGGANGTTAAAYAGNIITVNVAVGATIANVSTAIDGLADFTATVASGSGLTFVPATDYTTYNNPLSGGVDAAVNDVLSDDLVVKIAGSTGAEVFTFETGATLTQIVNAVNLVSDATGVEANDNGGTLELRSTGYGSDAIVDVEVLEEGALGTFEAGLSDTRDEGTDVVATVNGVTANGSGNTLSINTTTLDLSLTVADGSNTAISFTINAGGAVFQLGPQVVSNQQARIGIGSVSTGELGGVDGRLYQLRSGNDSDLATDPNNATLIVDASINKITSLRGRLGAFQRTTLETNIASLADTITNLVEAESSIRDADFAAESARLTRAQILVQSGTQVLAIANQNPQNVLALLRG
jgi:flagellin